MVKLFKILYYRYTLATPVVSKWVFRALLTFIALVELGEKLGEINPDFTIPLFGLQINVPDALQILGAIAAFIVDGMVKDKQELTDKVK